ncbi:MAG TPA: hypothetical protein HPQ03_13065 [Deltaproteobacteria bacterium]|nr:hypothetical protein [Deltaproteobacteria bacterium]
MTYIPANDSSDGAKVLYESKDGKTSKTFVALDWLAQLATHIPNRGEQADFAIVAYPAFAASTAE